MLVVHQQCWSSTLVPQPQCEASAATSGTSWQVATRGNFTSQEARRLLPLPRCGITDSLTLVGSPAAPSRLLLSGLFCLLCKANSLHDHTNRQQSRRVPPKSHHLKQRISRKWFTHELFGNFDVDPAHHHTCTWAGRQGSQTITSSPAHFQYLSPTYQTPDQTTFKQANKQIL